MASNVSSRVQRVPNAPLSTLRVIRRGEALSTVALVAQRTASGTAPDFQPALTEEEQRRRLVYWVKQRMGQVGIDSVRELAREMGRPPSTVAKWFGGKETGSIPLIWLADLCRALRVDPVWFLVLPEIPGDPATPHALEEGDPLLAVLVASRHARQVAATEVAAAQPAAARPPAPRRKRAASGVR